MNLPGENSFHKLNYAAEKSKLRRHSFINISFMKLSFSADFNNDFKN